MSIFMAVVVIAVVLGLAFFRASIWGWLIGMVALVVPIVALDSRLSDEALQAIYLTLAAIVALFGIPALRRLLVSSFILSIFRKFPTSRPYSLIAAAALVLGIFFLLPLLILLVFSFAQRDTYGGIKPIPDLTDYIFSTQWTFNYLRSVEQIALPVGQRLNRPSRRHRLQLFDCVRADHGFRHLRVRLVGPHQTEVLSANSVVTITSDTSPPTITSAATGRSLTSVTLVFSEPVDTTAELAGKYTLDKGAAVTNVTRLSPLSVRLATTRLSQLTDYTLTVNGVRDSAGNIIAAGYSTVFRTFTFSRGFAFWERWDGAARTGAINTFTNNLANNFRPPDVIGYSEFNAGKYAPNVGDEVSLDIALEAIAK